MLISALAVSCRGGSAGDMRPVVMTSLPPLQSLAADIAGDSLRVLCMTTSGADPETFDPSMAVMCDLYDSRMFLNFGVLPFEQRLTDRLAGEAPGILVANVSDGVRLMYGTHEHCDGQAHRHGAPDPHLWTSARNLVLVAGNIAGALGEADPDNAAYYRHRADSISRRLAALDMTIARRLAPYRGDTVMVWHPALSYFARDYGLNQLPLGTEGKEGSVRAMREALDAAGSGGVRALFYMQPSDSARAADAGRQAGIVPTLLSTMSPNYIHQLNVITDAIANH